MNSNSTQERPTVPSKPRRKRFGIGFVIAILFTSIAGLAIAGTASGTLSGWNTVDYVYATGKTNGDVVPFTFSVSGNGNNYCTLKIQQMKSNGGWKTLQKIKRKPGWATYSGSYTVENLLNSSSEMIRYRFARDLGTKQINYTLVD